jgi:hypothetical protein
MQQASTAPSCNERDVAFAACLRARPKRAPRDDRSPRRSSASARRSASAIIAS